MSKISGRIVLKEFGIGIPDLLVSIFDVDPKTQPEEIITTFTGGTQDGWDSARFSGIVLSFDSFPFLSLFLSNRRYRLLHLSSAEIDPL